MINRTKDRVSISYDRKFNLGNYESLGISAGYSTDVRKGETLAEAWKRCDDQATKQFEAMCQPIEELTQGNQPKKKGKYRGTRSR